MSSAGIFVSIMAALAVGAMSPGPSFVVVSRIAISRSRLDGLAAAFGMGAGGVVFAVLALAGLTALLSQFEWLYVLLKVAGGAYLVYIAVNIWRSAGQPLEVSDAANGNRAPRLSFMTALLTQLSNPKTIIVYASIFAALYRGWCRSVSSSRCRSACSSWRRGGIRSWPSPFRPATRGGSILPRRAGSTAPRVPLWPASAFGSFTRA